MADIPPANDDLLHQAILHGIFLQRYKAGLARRVTEFLDREVLPEVLARVEADLASIAGGTRGLSLSVRGRLRGLQLTTQELLDTGRSRIAGLVEDELQQLAATEGEWQITAWRRHLPVKIELSVPAPAKLEAILSSQPFEGELLRDWFRSLAASTQQAISRQINIGMMGGESIAEISRRLSGTRARAFTDGVFQTTRRNAEIISRTAAAHVSMAARQITIDSNLSVVKGVLWVSTLDTRTSEICMGLDGKVFAPDEGPRPPAHFNCRSTIIALLKSWRELGFDKDELPPSTRASLNGQVPERITYGEWLRNQPLETQVEALGSNKARLFRSGQVEIDRFTDDRGRPLTIKQLRSKLRLP